MTHTSRRSLLGGLACLIASPAIVRASSLMPSESPSPPALSQWYICEDFTDYRLKMKLIGVGDEGKRLWLKYMDDCAKGLNVSV